jgi:hypothetical protein
MTGSSAKFIKKEFGGFLMTGEKQKKKMPLPYLLIIIILLATFLVVVSPLELLIKTILLFSLILIQLVIAFLHSRRESGK